MPRLTRSEDNQIGELSEEVRRLGSELQRLREDFENQPRPLGKRFTNALVSTNFQSGSIGWRIRDNGDVEFNDGNFRGDLVIGDTDGAFVEITQDTDDFGRINIYDSDGSVRTYLTQGEVVVGDTTGFHIEINTDSDGFGQLVNFDSDAIERTVLADGSISFNAANSGNPAGTVVGTGNGVLGILAQNGAGNTANIQLEVTDTDVGNLSPVVGNSVRLGTPSVGWSALHLTDSDAGVWEVTVDTAGNLVTST